MQSIKDAKDVSGKRVLVRASLNEPVQDGVVQSDFRLRKMLPTFNLLRESGAKIILIGHASGDPNTQTLLPSAQYFQQHFPITFIEDPFNDEGKMVLSNMQDGDVVMAENLRRYPGEIENDEHLGRQLAGLADIYVNENFAASHRAHASLMWPPKLLPSYAGLQFEEEFTYLSQALNPPHPSLLIIAGAKPETKVPLARKMLDVVDTVFVGGLPANELLVAQGHDLGKSLVSGEDLGVEAFMNHPKLLLPLDVWVLSQSGEKKLHVLDDVRKDDKIVDAGTKTLKLLEEEIAKSSFVFWNGPLGSYEEGFKESTLKLAEMIAKSSAESIVGGGDTVAVIEPLGIADDFTFLSTAGGAMIDFLAHGTLPAIEAINNSPHN